VEARNAEIRKDVLKYDEVMNEQRKVIYKRRQQVIEGEDIHDATIELIEERIADAVASHVGTGFHEEWDINALVLDLQSYYPDRTDRRVAQVYTDAEEIGALVIDEAVGKYEKKAENFPGGLDTAKEIERDVMLQILDQRWRDHLSDMDYLRDGIHLRQTAQQDPLNAWQKEGYLMFEHLLDAVDIDYVRYITHVEATAAIEESTVDDGLEGSAHQRQRNSPGRD
jgi:preprotein translocase subunit SecA